MYVICFSGGHSSALCAIETVRKFGKANVVLLNHNISPIVEHPDIKRFKQEIADYLGLPITYANHQDWANATPISVCLEARGFKIQNGKALCTNRLKTSPFKKWLEENDPDKQNTYVYGFDGSKEERERANRRAQIMGLDGYKTAFPLINWERTIYSTQDIGVTPP